MQRLHKILALAIICAAVRAHACPASCACDSTRVACDAAVAPQDRLGDAHFLPYGTHLLEVSWTNSKLNTLELEVFVGLGDVEHIDLSRNEIKRTENGMFAGLSRLNTLNLSRNFIDDIPRLTFASLTSLEVLDVSHNRLHVIPFQLFEPMIKLQHLDISHNKIATLTDYFFVHNRQLKVLLLNDNSLVKITYYALAKLKELETLDISSNKLDYIHKSIFDDFEQLSVLNLSFNPFQNISQDAYRNLKNLRWLNMSGSRLRTLPPTLFQYNENLETIYLDHTELEVIQNNNLKGLSSLQQLYIRNNKFLLEIETLVFRDTPNITHLDLSSNALLSLPESLTMLKDLQELRLKYNPWECDCRMVWFAGWAERNLEIIKSDLTCPLTYPNDMLRILNHTKCEPPTLEPTMQQSESDIKSGIDSSRSNTNTTRTYNKRNNTKTEPAEVKKQTTEASSSVIQEADENDLFGQILPQKLKKMNDEDRLKLTHQIQNLVFKEEIKAISRLNDLSASSDACTHRTP